MKVGWIGLGNIGAPMAQQILGGGHQVTAIDRGAGRDEVKVAGGRLAKDYVEIATGCDVLGICVFTDAQMREALLDSGALAAMRPGSVLVVHTTGSPTFSKELAALAPRDVDVIDACFSGGPQDVLNGELTLMIGGTAQGLARARPAIQCYANNIHHVGAAGAGQTLKLLNNLLFATNLYYAAEIMHLVESQGMDTAKAAKVIQQSSGASRGVGMFAGGRSREDAMEMVRPYMIKDVEVAKTVACASNVNVKAFQTVFDFYR